MTMKLGQTATGYLTATGDAADDVFSASFFYGSYDKPWIISGGNGEDVLYGSGGDDRLYGDDGDDELYGSAGNDQLFGGWGDDVVKGGSGNDIMEGGHGSDFMMGGSGSDVLRGQDDGDVLYGEDGDDWLYGDSGTDVIYGGFGNDYLSGGANADHLYGGPGDDTYEMYWTQAGYLNVEIDEQPGEGVDTVLLTGTYFRLINNLENLKVAGSVTADTKLEGNELNNVIAGGVGSDLILGWQGNDTMSGGLGDDTYAVDSHADVVIEGFGAGTDTIHLSPLLNHYTLPSNVEDLIVGTVSDSSFTGNERDNAITSGGGDDTVLGLAGRDRLFGNAGDDVIDGGAQRDSLTGGEGSDTFRYTQLSDSAGAGRDEILDFVRGQDRIDLSGIDANVNLAGNQAFVFSPIKPIFTSAGDLWATTGRDGITRLHADVDGDGFEDLSIELVGVQDSLSAADFIL